MDSQEKERKLAIVGLGYVGLPLAIEFGKNFPVIGFDINEDRVTQLNSGIDKTREVSRESFIESKFCTFSNSISDISSANIYIITVPTPIDSSRQPDLSFLKNASNLVAGQLSENNFVIYESTVYPGATEEVCVPILETVSGLCLNKDFYVGYSPERINPGDKNHRLTEIVKITSGSNEMCAKFVDDLYGVIIKAGTHRAESIRVAEAAKVIENTQRDVNIALINEFATLFNKMEIDTESVLNAAETKWNFLSFRPGLVGGHCIGVDPYYLTYKAQEVGHHPEIILAGRRLNDAMGAYVVDQTIEAMKKNNIVIKGSHALIMGITFKENCPDIRNSKAFDLVAKMKQLEIEVDVFDPLADKVEVMEEYGVSLINEPRIKAYDTIILAVAHREFKEMGFKKTRSFGKENCIIYDLKYLLKKQESNIRI